MVAPGPPSKIKVDVISSDDLNVSWDLPVEANWVITRYEVAIYEKEKENINSWRKTWKEQIIQWVGYSSYMVEVLASTKAERGNYSDPVVARTYPERKIELICGHSSNGQRALVIYIMCTKIVFIVQFNGHKGSSYHVQLMRDDHTTNML